MIVLPARSTHIIQILYWKRSKAKDPTRAARTHPHNTLVAVRSHRWCISVARSRDAAVPDVRAKQGGCIKISPLRGRARAARSG